MGSQSPAASASKPADQTFGKALNQATRPGSAPVRQSRPETARPQTPSQPAREQTSATETQPCPASVRVKDLEASRPDVSIDESGESTEVTAAEAMAPFYMAALFDQSASYLQPSAQVERIAAAERVQDFVANWLQTQTQVKNPASTTAPAEAESQAESIEVVSTALNILSQYVEETLGQTTGSQNNTPQESSVAGTASDQQTQLNQRNTAELRQLMAVMMQSGRIPEPFNQQPSNKDLQQQLDRILPLVISASSAAAQAVTEKSAQTAAVNQTIPVGTQISISASSAAAQAVTEKSAQTAAVNQTIPVGRQISIEVQQTQGSGQERAQRLVNFSQAAIPVALSDENPAPNPSLDKVLAGQATDPKTGLQESQMAKIFATASSERMSTDTTFAAPSTVVPEESTSSGQPETGEVKFSAPPQQRADNLIHMVSNGLRLMQAAPTADNAPIKLIQLPSGQQLPETLVVDQVVSHLAAGNNGETSRMLLRLNPAELGTLRIELTMEGDKLRAQLHAQTQQVQEVLDRHLPQLRDALQMQGLKIDSFRVDVQAGHSQARDQASQWQQPQQQGHQGHRPAVTDWPPPELDIPLQQILQQPAGSISLRV